MNKYYYDLIIQKLKKDIISSLEGYCDSDILIKEVNDYFKNNTIVFNETDKITGTHQVRNRDAYEKKPNKCKALVWNEGHGGQCSRTMKDGCNGFCKSHFTKGGDDWFLGTIEKRIERPVDANGKIYKWLEH